MAKEVNQRYELNQGVMDQGEINKRIKEKRIENFTTEQDQAKCCSVLQ